MAHRLAAVVSSLQGPSKGINILGTKSTYIIRSDVGCYFKVKDLKTRISKYHGETVQCHVFPLHHSWTGGDHYFGYYNSYELHFAGRKRNNFYMLKGNDLYVGEDLSKEAKMSCEIHPKCQGGDFYIGTCVYHTNNAIGIFIVLKGGQFEAFHDLKTGKRSDYYKSLYNEPNIGPHYLHESIKGGLYCWAIKSKKRNNPEYYIVKGVDACGNVKVHHTYNLHTDEHTPFVRSPTGNTRGDMIDLSPSVTNLLHGGLVENMVGQWQLVGSPKQTNQEKIKVGYDSSLMQRFKANWMSNYGYIFEENLVGNMFASFIKVHFLVDLSYESHILDKNSDHRTRIKLEGSLQLEEEMYIWQLVIMSKKGSLLYTPHFLTMTTASSKHLPAVMPEPKRQARPAQCCCMWNQLT